MYVRLSIKTALTYADWVSSKSFLIPGRLLARLIGKGPQSHVTWQFEQLVGAERSVHVDRLLLAHEI
jgi:hypothetical protein